MSGANGAEAVPGVQSRDTVRPPIPTEPIERVDRADLLTVQLAAERLERAKTELAFARLQLQHTYRLGEGDQINQDGSIVRATEASDG